LGGGEARAIAAILDFKRRGRLGRVERAANGEGITEVDLFGVVSWKFSPQKINRILSA